MHSDCGNARRAGREVLHVFICTLTVGRDCAGRKRGGLTSRDEVPPAANLPPHIEENPIFLVGPRGLGDSWVELFTEALCGLIIRSPREILGNLVPTVTVLANGLQEQLVFLEGPSPLSKGGIKGMNPTLSASLVGSTLNELGYFDPIDLFAGG